MSATPNASENMTNPYFTSTSRTRPTGRTSRYRSVPAEASPATESPDRRPAPSGRKNGWISTSEASGAKNPFDSTCPRNAAAPGPAAERPESLIETTTRTANATSPSART